MNYSGADESVGQRTQTIQAIGDSGSSATMHWSSSPGTKGGVGDYVVGRFTATAASLALHFNGSLTGQLCGFQLRHPPTGTAIVLR